jgi:hypothetical protein
MNTDGRTSLQVGVLVAVLGCGGCSINGPISLIADNGQILRGNFTASVLAGRSFSVTDGILSCSGKYDLGASSGSSDHPTITIPVKCWDGRFGLVEAMRGQGHSGGGTFKLNEGTNGVFVWGGTHVACSTIGARLGATAQSACSRESAQRSAAAAVGLAEAAANFNAVTSQTSGLSAAKRPPATISGDPRHLLNDIVSAAGAPACAACALHARCQAAGRGPGHFET